MNGPFIRRTACRLPMLVLALLLPPVAVHAEIHALGAMGDSLSDEYAEESYAYAANWLEQLALYRGLDVGPTAAQAGQPGNTWGEPRRTGYRFNWARSGDDSHDLLAHGQHTGLATLVSQYGLTNAVLIIGANDFYPLPLPGYAYYEIYQGRWTQQQINAYTDQIIANLEQALDAVLPTGVSLVLCNVPDYGVTIWPRVLFPDPAKRDRVTVVIEQLNGGIELLALSRHLVVVDMFAATQAIFGTNQSPRETLLLGNVIIYVQQRDTQNNTTPQAGFVHDGTHPHTHLQGVLANVILFAADAAYHAGIPVFSEAEILNHAGLTYGGFDTLAGEIGAYGDYMRDYTLADGDLDQDQDVDLADASILGRCLAGADVRQPPPGCTPAEFNRADLNGDYDVDLDDFRRLQVDFGRR